MVVRIASLLTLVAVVALRPEAETIAAAGAAVAALVVYRRAS